MFLSRYLARRRASAGGLLMSTVSVGFASCGGETCQSSRCCAALLLHRSHQIGSFHRVRALAVVNLTLPVSQTMAARLPMGVIPVGLYQGSLIGTHAPGRAG